MLGIRSQRLRVASPLSGARLLLCSRRHNSNTGQAAALIDKLSQLNVTITTSQAKLQSRSQDYYWYSPVLRAALKGQIADVVCLPKTEEEVIAVMRECFQLGISITPRGAGTGNYGQAVPLRGGAILDLSGLIGYEMVREGVVRAQAGQLMGLMEEGLRKEHDQELRFFPSTVAQATIGGFVGGGSCGVGSINYGVLRDPGNVSALRVVTMEAEPRVLELTGDDCLAAVHAYGTNGIITAVEMPLAPAQSWREVAATFPDLASAAAAGLAIGESPAVAKRNICTLGAPIPSMPGFEGMARQIAAAGGNSNEVTRAGGMNIMSIGVASIDIARHICEQHGGSVQCVYAGGREAGSTKRKIPLYEWAWNHTTLRALRKDENITYLQCGYSDPLGGVLELQERYGGAQNEDEYMTHVEWVRLGGRVSAFGLPLLKWKSKERLDQLIAEHNAAGAPVFNPHTFVLEDGGMKQTDAVQLAFKQENDPMGLLNPGKMRAWEEGRPVVEGVLNAYDKLREGVSAPELAAEPLTPEMIAELDKGKRDGDDGEGVEQFPPASDVVAPQ